MPDLDQIFPGSLARALESVPEPERWASPDDIDEALDGWAEEGVEIVDLGSSLEGSPIRAAVFEIGPDPDRTMLAWGYPHPDEPIGATGLLVLGQMVLRGRLQALEGWRLVLLPCADPDQARRQLWLGGDGSARDWGAGVWRPTHLGLEVDYGFPIDWPPFLQTPGYDGRCHTEAQCRTIHGGPPCPAAERPWRTLPESEALALAIDRFRPELVASMHSTHTSGDYTFLLRREKDRVLNDLLAIPDASGTGRHLGEAIDRGRRWRSNAPDLIRELTLENRRRALQRRSGYQPGFLYAGNAAAAAYVEALDWPAQFVCPETALFRHPDFSDTRPSETRLELKVGTEKRPGGKYLVTRFKDQGSWVIGQQTPAGRDVAARRQRPYVPRSVLGVRALLRRRRALSQADLLWEKLSGLSGLRDHPYREERARISVPGSYVSDGSMLIFRAREDYRRRASRAQEASFNWIWPLHTVSLLGNMRSWLFQQDPERPEIIEGKRELAAIQEAELDQVPDVLRRESAKAPAIRSGLARVIRLMLVERR